MTEKKPLIKLEERFVAGAAPLRTIKMAQPICEEHQRPGNKWVAGCLAAGHKPFQTSTEVPYEEPIYEIDEDGDKVRVGVKQKIKLVTEWNITQVPLDEGINSGRGPADYIKKGFVYLEDMGIAPVCQMNNCYRQVKVRGPYGDYCSPEHARLVAATQDRIPLEILDGRKRRRQLNSINVTDA